MQINYSNKQINVNSANSHRHFLTNQNEAFNSSVVYTDTSTLRITACLWTWWCCFAITRLYLFWFFFAPLSWTVVQLRCLWDPTVSPALELPIRLTEVRGRNLNPAPAAHYANEAERALMKVSRGSVPELLECRVHTSGVTETQVNS